MDKIEEMFGYDFVHLKHLPAQLLFRTKEIFEIAENHKDWAIAYDTGFVEQDREKLNEILMNPVNLILVNIRELRVKSFVAAHASYCLNYKKGDVITYLYPFQSRIGKKYSESGRATFSAKFDAISAGMALQSIRDVSGGTVIVCFRSTSKDHINGALGIDLIDEFTCVVQGTDGWELELEKVLKRSSKIYIDHRYTTESMRYELDRIEALGKNDVIVYTDDSFYGPGWNEDTMELANRYHSSFNESDLVVKDNYIITTAPWCLKDLANPVYRDFVEQLAIIVEIKTVESVGAVELLRIVIGLCYAVMFEDFYWVNIFLKKLIEIHRYVNYDSLGYFEKVWAELDKDIAGMTRCSELLPQAIEQYNLTFNRKLETRYQSCHVIDNNGKVVRTAISNDAESLMARNSVYIRYSQSNLMRHNENV